MLTKDDLTQLRYICSSLGATTREEIEDIINRYIKAKNKVPVNRHIVIKELIEDLEP